MALYAFDGTWNDANRQPKDESTNIYRFSRLYSEERGGNVFYCPGPGSRFGQFGYYAGGIAGLGTRWRVQQALSVVYEQFMRGDKAIDVIGFSRGAATAVAFVWALHQYGVRAPLKKWPFVFTTMDIKRGEVVASNPNIRFLGLFDTVFTTADLNVVLPFQEARRVRRTNSSRNFAKLPENVANAYHAMAIHEKTVGFGLTRFSNAQEMWFPGVHGDIGGSTSPWGMTTASMQWMVQKAKAADVPVDLDDVVESSELAAPKSLEADAHLYRKILPGDRIHQSAAHLGIDR